AIIVIVTVIPSAMQAAVRVDPDAGAAVVAVAVVTAITPYINAEPLGVGDRRCTNGDSCQCGQYVRELPHCSFSTRSYVEKTNVGELRCRELQETFLNMHS